MPVPCANACCLAPSLPALCVLVCGSVALPILYHAASTRQATPASSSWRSMARKHHEEAVQRQNACPLEVPSPMLDSAFRAPVPKPHDAGP